MLAVSLLLGVVVVSGVRRLRKRYTNMSFNLRRVRIRSGDLGSIEYSPIGKQEQEQLHDASGDPSASANGNGNGVSPTKKFGAEVSGSGVASSSESMDAYSAGSPSASASEASVRAELRTIPKYPLTRLLPLVCVVVFAL